MNELIDKYFPIRDKNDNPSYRPHQKETIIKILKAFNSGKKFVAVDGPVGCGKSAINYTVARVIGSAVYLTPLKMLQDQIVSENWPGVKMLKGRNAYTCNKCGYDTTEYRCDYKGEDHSTCQNSKTLDSYGPQTINNIGKEIDLIHKRFGNNKFLIRLRTAFSSKKEYFNLMPEIEEFLVKEKARLMELGVKNPYGCDRIEPNIACSMGVDKECPANSSKLLAKMSPIRVLNPDIFFLVNKSQLSFYHSNDLMIYDECQQIEGVMSRIFKVTLPLETIRNLFGVDMLRFYNIEKLEDCISQFSEYIKTTLGPLMCAAMTIGNLGDVMAVRNWSTLKRVKSLKEPAELIKRDLDSYLFRKMEKDENWSFSILEVVNRAFTGEDIKDTDPFKNFIKMVRSYFEILCESIGCEKTTNVLSTIVPACSRINNQNDLNRKIRSRTRPLTRAEKEDFVMKEVLVSKDLIYADHIYMFGKTVKDFVGNAISLLEIKKDEKPSFTIDSVQMESLRACKGTPLYREMKDTPYAYRKEKCLQIIPVAIGRLMNNFFYSKAQKVLLTSGTWVCPEKTFKIYGIPGNDVEFIKIPSAFDPDRRKIFVIDNKDFTNFSEKNYDGGYKYKTKKGIKDFTLELCCIISRVRNYIKAQHEENSNIIVHCHTFDIACNIARYASCVDSKFLIHLPKPGMSITNEKNNHTIWHKDKDDLIEMIKDCPNSGLTLVSPSISEGVDFKGDIARAQIILKRPVPYLGDTYVMSYYKGNPEVGIERDPDFLDRVCFTTITQQYGRVMRSIDDWGYTVIMDQSITMALKGLSKRRRRINELNIGYFWEGVQIYINKSGRPSFPWIFG